MAIKLYCQNEKFCTTRRPFPELEPKRPFAKSTDLNRIGSIFDGFHEKQPMSIPDLKTITYLQQNSKFENGWLIRTNEISENPFEHLKWKISFVSTPYCHKTNCEMISIYGSCLLWSYEAEFVSANL